MRGASGRPTLDSAREIQRELQASRVGAAILRPGYLVITEFSSSGAKDDEPAETAEDRERVLSLQTRITKLINSSYQVLYKAFPHTPLGFYCEYDRFNELDALLEELRNAAHYANEWARALKSKRVTRVQVYPFDIDVENTRLAVRMGQFIYERLLELKEGFYAETSVGFMRAFGKSRHLERIVQGRQSELIRLAIESAVSQRPQMIARYGGTRHRGATKEKEFDFTAIDGAISVFEQAKSAYL